MIAALAQRFDYVVIDTPALADSSDGVEVSLATDATLVVVRAGDTRRPDVARAIASIELVGPKVAGLVLTRARGIGRGYGRYAAGDTEPAGAAHMADAASAVAE